MKVCKTHGLPVVLLTTACAFLLSTAMQAQTDPGPRPVGSNDQCAIPAGTTAAPIPNTKFPKAPLCIDNAQPADANGNNGAGNVISFVDNLTPLWFAALPVFGTTATISAPHSGGANITGLGPSFNAISCFQCHSQPATGGSSPNSSTLGFPKGNPQVQDAPTAAQLSAVSSFVSATGPVREARFVKAVAASGNADAVSAGTVAELFVIEGRSDKPSNCTIAQQDFTTQLNNKNVIFRIPIPTFGDGLVENTPDANLIANLAADDSIAANTNLFPVKLGITGTFNHSGNDSTITRFGWKAQNKSLLMFAGEAFNVEMGVTDDLMPNEKTNGNGNCLPTATDTQPEDTVLVPPTPDDSRDVNALLGNGPAGLVSDISSDIEDFVIFMRLNAPPGQCAFNSKVATAGPAQCFSLTCTSATTGCVNPNPSLADVNSIQRGGALFGSINPGSNGTLASPSVTPAIVGGTSIKSIGCVLCHSDLLTTGPSQTSGLNNVSFSPFSDFALHTMDSSLADGVSQGQANGSQFRTAPLWGIGQRLFFMHDGRASDLLTAIKDHAPTAGTASGNCTAAMGEACEVIVLFNNLPATSTNGSASKQDILNFLRSL